MAHEGDDGKPCTRHAARVDDLVPPAVLGMSCFAALHDLAAVLQAVGGAVEELDATVTDPALRAAVADAVEASDRAMKVFVASRNLLRDPSGHKTAVSIATLVDRAGQRSTRRPTLVGATAAGNVDVALPVIAQAIASLLVAADTSTGAAELSTAIEGGTLVLVVAAAAAAEPPASIGATLAIASRVAESHGGAVRCGQRDGKATYTVVLPMAT
jgi:hypothetical protein